MSAHLTYEDALQHDPQLSRLLVAIQAAGTRESSSTEFPSRRCSPSRQALPPFPNELPDSRVPLPRTPAPSRPAPTPPSQARTQLTELPNRQHPLPRIELSNHRVPAALPPAPQTSTLLTESSSSPSPPVKPRPHSIPSNEGHSENEIDHLINLFEDLSSGAGTPPSQVPGTPQAVPIKLYHVSSGSQTGIYDRWADAGHLSQGVPDAHVRKVWDHTPRNTSAHPRYAVREVDPLVTGIPGNIHKGFVQRYEAERAYVLAYAMGALRTLPRRGSDDIGPPPATPTPQAIMDAFASMPNDFLGAEWYVVYKGRRPGLYPTWNFAASQTINVGCAIHDKFPSKALAEQAWMLAQTQPGWVQVLV